MDAGTPRFLIVTTRHLPEAYFLASFLLDRGQRVGLLNLTGRPMPQKLRVLGRLGHHRGGLYLIDLLLGRALRRLLLRSTVAVFPEVHPGLVARVRRDTACRDCKDLHAADTLAFVRGLDPHYIVLAGAPIVRPALIGLSRHGTLNRHLGLAPAYRGSDCPLWALACNEPDAVGFTIQFVSEKVDAGDVIVREPVPIAPGLSLEAYLARVQRKASEALAGVLDSLIAHRSLPRHGQPAEGRHFPPAGLSTLRRAARHYASLVHRAPQTVQPRAEVTAA